jgi:hypothetical protein
MEIARVFASNKSSHTVIRVAVLASLLFASQAFSSTPKAEASTVGDVYSFVSTSVAFGIGDRYCGISCGAAAGAAVVVVNDNASKAAEAAVVDTRSTLQRIFGFWGFH